ncbi:MAG: cysteine desulfurase family protein, partial [Corynebacterium glutamicum]|nr:cysteine desulfurase family protein [Corynebacterium glutamicum]
HASPLNRIISTPIEHPGILETVKALELGGAEAELMPIGPDGRVSSFEALDKPAAVATMMWANNETGAIQPVSEFIAAAQASGTPTHIDAVQVVGHLPVNFDELGATTLAASAHKFGGPRGVGLLLARRSPAPSAVLHGGGQERGIRPGTLDVAGAAATAAALREAVAELDGEATRLRGLKKMLLDAILHTIPNVLVHTTEPSLPGHLHLSFPGAEGDSLIMLLDSLRIEASTGSACSNGVNRASHVLLAMGISETDARGAIRFTLGRTTTEESIKAVIAVIEDVVTRARTAGMAF